MRPRTSGNEATVLPETEHIEHLLQLGHQGLEKYLGYYFEYHLSMACPGKLLRMLTCIERREDKVYYQRTERLQETPDGRVYHGKYIGLATFLIDRIFLVDYETITDQEITQTILFPSFKNRVTRLTGLKLGVSGSGERMPCCARVMYEYLGSSVDIRRALKLCGLYDLDSPDIDDNIKQAIANDIRPEEWHFRARH